MTSSFSPRKLTSKEAKHYADAFLLMRDLKHVIQCCEAIIEVLKSPVDKFYVLQALSDSAVIGYRRCFNSSNGVRVSLRIRGWTDADRLSHEFFLDYGNRHVAHSINDFEQSYAYVYVSENSDGSLARGSIGGGGLFRGGLSSVEADQLKELAKKAQESADAWIKRLSLKLKEQISKMSDEQLLALEMGGAYNHRFDVKSRRMI